jgi:hypothetical protein
MPSNRQWPSSNTWTVMVSAMPRLWVLPVISSACLDMWD